jgi:hypothetical protein
VSLRAFFSRFIELLTLDRPAPVPYEWFTADEIGSVHRHFAASSGSCIDDQTWRELQLPAYSRLIAQQTSLAGRQMLFHRLKSGERPRCDLVVAAADGAEADAIELCEAARERLRCLETDLGAALFHPHGIDLPHWSDKVWLVSTLGLAGLLAITAKLLVLGVSLICVYAVLSIATSLRLAHAHRRWLEIRRAVLVVARAGSEWAAVAATSPSIVLEPLVGQAARFRSAQAAVQPSFLERLPLLVSYINLFVLYEYATLRRRVTAFECALENLRSMYLLVADAEANMCIASHLRRTALHCRPAESTGRAIGFEEMSNPLLPDACGLSVQLDGKGAFLSGRNGSGKSTFLRTLGLNLVVFRAFGFCYALRACLPSATVVSSMANEDSLEKGESFYMAELRRMEETCAIVQTGGAVVVLADEIFRGTNAMEAVAVSSAVLRFLSERAIMFASSHHLVLAPLLRDWLRPMCIGTTRHGTRQLEDGVLADTNGVDLMATYDFPASIKEAARLTSAWLVDYYTHPAEVPRDTRFRRSPE